MRQYFLVLCLVVLLSGFQVIAKWTIDTTTTATTLVGVGAANARVASAAAALNGQGAIIDTFNGTAWLKTPVTAGLLMDSAVSADGLVVSTSMYSVFVSNDFGATFRVADGVSGLSQSASVFNDGTSIGLVGSFLVKEPNSKFSTGVSGVAYSRDAGITWAVSSPVPVGYVRYGAFPTDQTWYVSSGIWSDATTEVGQINLSARLSVHPENRIIFNDKRTKRVKEGPTGWFGAVSKTTDGGKTWTQVFSSDLENDYYYFNGISCPSENHCVVVGEGEDATGADLNVAYTTFDGGLNWERTITAHDASMMGVDFVSENEGYVAATGKSGRNLAAQFYHTTDGGKTFAVEETLTNCFVLDVDMTKDGAGVAACSSSTGSACFAALYTK